MKDRYSWRRKNAATKKESALWMGVFARLTPKMQSTDSAAGVTTTWIFTGRMATVINGRRQHLGQWLP